MTHEQEATLAALAEAKRQAEAAKHGFGYVNVAGRSERELADIARRGAELDAAWVEATARYRTFMDMVGVKAEEETRAHYAHLVGNV